MTTLTPERIEEQADDDLIRIGCKAADVHLTCSWPRCQCTQIPKAIQAVLNAQDRRAISRDGMREALVKAAAIVAENVGDRGIAELLADIDAALSAKPAQGGDLRVKDNDAGEISVMDGAKEIRGWSYANDLERRAKMLCAREFVEGWYQAMEAMK